MPNWWIFQGDPDQYDIIDAIRTLPQLTWYVSRYQDRITEGDRVLLWKSGDEAGIYGSATVLERPRSRPIEPANDPRWRRDPGPPSVPLGPQ